MAAKGKKVKAETTASELSERRWAIISFEKREAKNLTYLEAQKKLAKLEAKKIAGLCIVSDEAAARVF